MEARIIENPIGAERIEFIKTSRDTNGEYSEYIQTMVGQRDGGQREHVHLYMEETYWVLEGRATYAVNGTVLTAETGDMVFIPIGTKHVNLHNQEPGKPLVLRRIQKPDMGVELFYRKLYELSREGAMNGKGKVGLMQLAVMAKHDPSGTYFTFSPVLLQRFWYYVLGTIGEMMGYTHIPSAQ
jgi:mannose-6-phosphate isomerase-like protein (cupin superfamily)